MNDMPGSNQKFIHQERKKSLFLDLAYFHSCFNVNTIACRPFIFIESSVIFEHNKRKVRTNIGI